MKFMLVIASLLVAGILGVAAQQLQPSDAIYWCNISRSQISSERDATMAQVETLKLNIATLNARIKELEARPKEAPQ